MGPLPEPDFNFGEQPHPSPPDYEDLANWTAHPERKDDAANVLVPTDGSPPPDVWNRPCDCFFVVGTNFIDAAWNAPVPDAVCDEWCDTDVVGMASSLNICCRIWAPRYRQTIVPAHNKFMQASATPERRKSAFASMDLAYSDVERSFEHFLQSIPNEDGPIVVSSHSQGSQHAIRLLEKFEEDSSLRKRLVCAYVLGPCGSFPMDKFERCFPSLRPCSGPLDVGCVVAFDSIAAAHPEVQALLKGEKKEDPFPVRNLATDSPQVVRYPGECEDSATGRWESPAGKTLFCTNPLTWTSEQGRAPESLHLGIGRCQILAEDGTEGDFDDCIQHKRTGVRVVSVSKAEVGTCFAEIGFDGGALLGSGKDNNHDEWSLFYFNIRDNVANRVESFLAGKPE